MRQETGLTWRFVSLRQTGQANGGRENGSLTWASGHGSSAWQPGALISSSSFPFLTVFSLTNVKLLNKVNICKLWRMFTVSLWNTAAFRQMPACCVVWGWWGGFEEMPQFPRKFSFDFLVLLVYCTNSRWRLYTSHYEEEEKLKAVPLGMKLPFGQDERSVQLFLCEKGCAEFMHRCCFSCHPKEWVQFETVALSLRGRLFSTD